MDNLGKLIYSYKHPKEDEMDLLLKAFAADSDDDDSDDDVEICDEDLNIKALLNAQAELKPNLQKVQEKGIFIEKAKLLAARAKFDAEIRDNTESLVVTYQFETAFLTPSAHRLFGDVVQMSDDMVILPPVEGSNQIMITLAYRMYE